MSKTNFPTEFQLPVVLYPRNITSPPPTQHMDLLYMSQNHSSLTILLNLFTSVR